LLDEILYDKTTAIFLVALFGSYFRLLKRIDNMDSSPTISLGWAGSGGFYLFSPYDKCL